MFKVGDRVEFGRKSGEKTLGEVTKVNRKTIKVKQLEARGTYRAYAVGTVWTVPKTLATKVEREGDSGKAAAKAGLRTTRAPARRRRKVSGEEAFEMLAAFGPGADVVNIMTGETYRTPER